MIRIIFFILLLFFKISCLANLPRYNVNSFDEYLNIVNKFESYKISSQVERNYNKEKIFTGFHRIIINKKTPNKIKLRILDSFNNSKFEEIIDFKFNNKNELLLIGIERWSIKQKKRNMVFWFEIKINLEKNKLILEEHDLRELNSPIIISSINLVRSIKPEGKFSLLPHGYMNSILQLNEVSNYIKKTSVNSNTLIDSFFANELLLSVDSIYFISDSMIKSTCIFFQPNIVKNEKNIYLKNQLIFSNKYDYQTKSDIKIYYFYKRNLYSYIKFYSNNVYSESIKYKYN
jgi:hypothetical protein